MFKRNRAKSTTAIKEAVRRKFDVEFYRQKNPMLGLNVDALEHYLQYGWRVGLDPAGWFSTKAYLSAYPDVAAAGVEPFSHYLLHGRSEHRVARPVDGTEEHAKRAFFESTGLYFAEFPEKFARTRYALATDMPTADRWTLLAHFVKHGVTDSRLYAAANADGHLLRAIGEINEPTNSAKALHCFQLAELTDARDAELLHKIGDFYLRSANYVRARLSYAESIKLGGNYYWTFVNAAQASSEIGDYNSSIDYYSQAIRKHPEKYAIRYSLRQAASDRFDIQWLNANSLSVDGDDLAASEEMHSAISSYRVHTGFDSQRLPFSRRSSMSALRIGIFGSDSLPQCTLYRITQKIDQLGSIDQAVDFYSLSQAEELERLLIDYDILIIYRAPAIPSVINILNKAQNLGVVTFYDIDDRIFDESCYPPSRQSLGTMVSPVEYAGLITGRALFYQAMKMCDYGIASTPPLQEAMAAIVRSGRCFLSRNALAQTHQAGMAASVTLASDVTLPCILFYGSGSRSHDENFSLIATGLARVLRRHPHVRLRVVGPVSLGSEFDKLSHQIERISFIANVAEYWRLLSEASVNLAPLTAGIFNDSKSEIKWMEAAMFGIPSVVSSSAVYNDVVHDGTDGFIARCESDWHRILDDLVARPDMRLTVGARAKQRVLRDYDIESGGRDLLRSLRDGLAEYQGSPQKKDDRKPLIVVVNIFYPPEYVGGATRVVEQSVADVFLSDNPEFNVEIFCGRNSDGRPGSIDRYSWNGINVTSLSPFQDLDGQEQSPQTEKVFSSYLDLLQPDLIHFHCIQRLGVSLVDVAKKRGIPFLVSVHDGWWLSDQQFLVDEFGVPVYDSGKWGDQRRLRRLRSALNDAVSTIAVSESHAQIHRTRGVQNVVVIANGSETLGGVTSAPTEGPVWLGLLGGFGLAKGSELLKQVLRGRKYQNIRFLIVDHAMLEGTRRHILWGDNQVEVVGKANFENVAQIYSCLHGILAISVCVESFGLVAREAHRLGRWVIASNRGGMSDDVVAGETGFIIDPAKVDDLANALDEIEGNPGRYRSPPARRSPLRGREEVAADLVSLYRRVLSDRPDEASE